MRTVKWSVGGKTYLLAYTVDAMLELQEEAGEVGEMIKTISENSREGVDLLCRCLHVLSREGELLRRAAGYEPADIPEEKDFRPMIAPRKRVELVDAVAKAVAAGLLTEEESEEEVDVTLLELQKKTEILVEKAGREPIA